MADLTTNPTSPAIGSYQYDVANNLAPGTSSSANYIAPTAPAPLTAVTTPITSESLQKNAPITLPEKTASTSTTASSSAIGEMAGINDNIKSDLQSEKDALAASVKNQRTAVDRNVSILANRGADQAAAEDAAGIPALKSTAQKLAQEYNTKTLAYNEQNRVISQDASLSSDQRARQLAAVSNDHAYEMTGLAIRSNIASGDYTAAQSLVDKAIDIKYGGLKDLITYQTNLLASDKSDLSDKDRSLLSIKLDENKRKLDEVTFQAHALQATKIDLIKSATSQNAPADVVAAIQNAPDDLSAFKAAGQYSTDQLDRQYKKAQISKIYQDIAESKAKAQAENGGAINVKEIQASGLPPADKNTALITAIIRANPKIDAGAKTQIANALGVIEASKSMASNNPLGDFAGVNPFNALLDVKIPFTEIGLPGRQAFRQKAGIENAGYINAINLKVQQWASGASLTKQQTDQVAKFTPSISDTDENVKTKLNNLTNFMLEQTSSQLQSQGVTFQPEKVNLFENAELLKKASPEQLQQLKDAGLIK